MQRVAYPSSTASWARLAHLRGRGQRPTGGVYVTDDWRQRQNLEAGGLFAVPLPEPAEVMLVAGLDVVLIASVGEKSVAAAQTLAGANPRYFATYWRGRGHEVVIQ